jgi:hypothetical protein
LTKLFKNALFKVDPRGLAACCYAVSRAAAPSTLSFPSMARCAGDFPNFY